MEQTDDTEHSIRARHPDHAGHPDAEQQDDSEQRGNEGRPTGRPRRTPGRTRSTKRGRERSRERRTSFGTVSRELLQKIAEHDRLRDGLDPGERLNAGQNPIVPDYRAFVLPTSNAVAHAELEAVRILLEDTPGIGYDFRPALQKAAVTIEDQKKEIDSKDGDFDAKTREFNEKIQLQTKLLKEAQAAHQRIEKQVQSDKQEIARLEGAIMEKSAAKEVIDTRNVFLESKVGDLKAELAASGKTTNSDAASARISQMWQNMAPDAQLQWVEFFSSLTGLQDTTLILENAINFTHQLSREAMHCTIELMGLQPEPSHENSSPNSVAIQSLGTDASEIETNLPDQRSSVQQEPAESPQTSQTDPQAQTKSSYSDKAGQNSPTDLVSSPSPGHDSDEFQSAIPIGRLSNTSTTEVKATSASSPVESVSINPDDLPLGDISGPTQVTSEDAMDQFLAFFAGLWAQFLRAWVQPYARQSFHALLLVFCVYFTVVMFQVRADWSTANTSIMRERIISWREDYWDLRCLQYLRWYVQMVIERPRNGKGHILLT